MNETTKSDMIMIMHRLKRLIGSSYHRKRIDIIITDNVHKRARLFITSGQRLKRRNTVA